MKTIWHDMRFALRQLHKSPGFTVVTILSLAIGIGANTAIFSSINGVLLKSLPVRDPQELRILGWTGSDISIGGLTSDSIGRSKSGQWSRSVFPYPLYRDFAENAQGLSDLFAFSYLEEGMTIRAHGVAAVAHGLMVSGNFFDAYGASVLIGQPITPQDDRPDAAPTAVITYRFWRQYYACDPHVLGQTLIVNLVPFTIIGVLPKHHRGPMSGDPSDFYVPIATQPRLMPDDDMLARSDDWWVRIMGRLAPGAGEARACTSLLVLFKGFLSTSDDRIHQPKILLQEGKRGLGMMYSSIAFVLAMLQGLVGLILLIACVNVASLLLARGAARQHEMSVRAAIGAGRWRLIRLSLVESLVLSLAAGAVGLVINTANKAAIAGFMARSLARTQEHLSYMGDHDATGMHLDQETDGTVLVFVLGIALLTTIVFGLVPALRAGRADPLEGLKGSSGRLAPRLRLGKGLISVQACLSTLLVITAGLLTRTVVNLYRVDPGFDTENCLTFHLNLLDSTPESKNPVDFFDRVRTNIAGIPGVRSVAFSTPGFPGAGWYADVSVPGHSDEEVTMPMYCICEGWFDTIGVTLLSGRDFNRIDSRRSSRVAIVNEAFVHECFDGEHPVGKPVNYNDDAYHIVGVCGNHKTDVRGGASPIIYFCQYQRRHGNVTFTVRSVLPPLSLVTAVRKAVADNSPDLPLEEVATHEQLLAESIVMERFFALLCGSLALLALLLSCIGIFGLMTYNVTRRTGEIGICMALGARPRDVAWPILREALVLTGIGVVAGMPVALGLTRLIRGFFFGVAAHDPATIIAAVVVLLGVAILAAWIPARRAAKIDPMEALRYE
jgi:predicted permease